VQKQRLSGQNKHYNRGAKHYNESYQNKQEGGRHYDRAKTDGRGEAYAHRSEEKSNHQTATWFCLPMQRAVCVWS